MGAGIFLMIVGAILAFAVRGDTNFVDIQVVGLILILGGAAAVWHARRGKTTEREVTHVNDQSDPARQVHTVREAQTEQDPDY